jgi:hypothetical protein
VFVIFCPVYSFSISFYLLFLLLLIPIPSFPCFVFLCYFHNCVIPYNRCTASNIDLSTAKPHEGWTCCINQVRLLPHWRSPIGRPPPVSYHVFVVILDYAIYDMDSIVLLLLSFTSRSKTGSSQYCILYYCWLRLYYKRHWIKVELLAEFSNMILT